ncbi:MAG: HEAT repeat domain-containing protein, partial [Actinomycetota bacterium]
GDPIILPKLAPEEVDYEGGAENYLFVKGARNISVLESMAHRAEEELEEGDFSRPGEEESEQSPHEPEAEEVPEKARDMLELLRDPEKLAGLLMGLGEQEEAVLDTKEHADAIYRFLKGASILMERNYPSLRNEYYRSMAESLLFLEAGLRNMLLIRQVLPNIFEDPLGKDILSRFTPQELVDLLSHFFAFAPELVSNARSILKVLGFSDRDLEAAIRAVKHKMLDLGEIDPSIINQLEQGDTEEGKGGDRTLPTLEEISHFFGEYRPDEIEQLRLISEFDIAEEKLPATTPILLDLVEMGSKLDSLGKAVELLLQRFWDHLEVGQIGYAAAILERAQTLLASRDPGLEPFRGQIGQLVQESASVPTVHLVIQLAHEQYEYTRDSRDFERYVSALGEKGVRAMIDALGTEEEMSVRKFICDTLAGLGKDKVRILGSYIRDERWYLVRNIVSVMARFRTPETIPYLKLTLAHPNDRVRAETVRALGMIGSYEARELLMQGLENPDEETRILCIRWLGRLRESRAIGIMIRMLEGKKDGAESPQLKKEIILSLGSMDSPDIYPVLKKYIRYRKLLNRSEWEEVNVAARKALEDLTARYSGLEDRG